MVTLLIVAFQGFAVFFQKFYSQFGRAFGRAVSELRQDAAADSRAVDRCFGHTRDFIGHGHRNTANVTVNITNKSILSAAATDLSTVDSKITDRVQGGALIVALANPFTVGGTLTVRLTPEGGTSVLKTVPLVASNSTPAPIPFTLAELKSLLGHKVTIAISGIVNSPTPVNVSPKQVIVVTTKLDLAIQLGG